MTEATEQDVRAEMMRQVMAAGGVVAWAARAGVTHTAVSLVLSGARPVSERLANACGYQKVTMFRRVSKGVQ